MLPDKVRLQHMLETAQLALQFISGVDQEHFKKNIGLQFQVTRALDIIGEAAVSVSEAFKRDHPHLPWVQLSRMRNRLIHAYFNVNLNLVWKTLTDDLPPLIAELQRILQEEGKEER